MIALTLRRFDDLLRGDATQLPNLTNGRFDLPAGAMSILLTILGMVYGVCMGLFSITPNGSGHAMQILAATVKVPALFLLTTVVTFPSLYVFNTLFGSKLRFLPTLRLIVGTLTVTLAVLSSIGPIVGFFSVSSTSYAFVVLMNVAVFAVSGALGLSFLLKTLTRIQEANRPLPPPLPEGVSPSVAAAMNRPSNGWMVLMIWILLFGVVGAQMGWVLRPFIGSPGQEFTWFRPISGNFFEAVTTQLQRLGVGR